MGAGQGCPPELCGFSLWGAEQPFCCLQELECIPEALDLSKSFKHVQGRELDSMILVGPLQLRRL